MIQSKITRVLFWCGDIEDFTPSELQKEFDFLPYEAEALISELESREIITHKKGHIRNGVYTGLAEPIWAVVADAIRDAIDGLREPTHILRSQRRDD